MAPDVLPCTCFIKIMKQLKASVHGRVQGVFFRQSTRQEALRLGLTGWVKNERDGTVSVVAVGMEEILKQFESYLHEGPPAAWVSRVDGVWTEAAQHFDGFEVRW